MANEMGPIFEELEAALVEGSKPGLFADGCAVFIYGTGDAAKDIYRCLAQRGIAVEAFIDRRAQVGMAWQGVPILHPEDAALGPEKRGQVHVVLGIFNGYVDVLSIRRWLVDLGYRRVTTFLELYEEFAPQLGDRYWLTPRAFYRGTQAFNQFAYDILTDDASKAVFLATLRCRFSMDYGYLPKPDTANQYLDPTVPSWREPMRFVDCGAYDGDTLAQFKRMNKNLESIAAFEPDPANFLKLSGYVTAERASLPEQIYLYPCGVDATCRQLRFASAQGTGSHAAASGDTVIQCVAIDDALHGFAPTLIKMDIEGAELAALLGAKRTIAEHRPGLAICLYHRPDHLWAIPRLVHEWYGARASYHIRSHGYSGFEQVLYVIPKS